MNRRSLFGKLIGAVVGIKAVPVLADAQNKPKVDNFWAMNGPRGMASVSERDDHALHITEHMKYLRTLHENGYVSPLRLEGFLNHVQHHCVCLRSGNPLMSDHDRKFYIECCEIVITHKRKL